MAGLLACGNVFVDRKINGVWQGIVPFGNATKFEIKTNSELKQRTSRKCENYGQAVDSVTIQRPAELNITLDELDRESLAIIFLGTSAAQTIAGGTITDELIPVVTVGKIIRTASANISSVVVSDATGATAFTEGTDYEIVNAAVGLIKILEGGSIVAGVDVSVDYVSADVTANVVTGGTDPNIKLRYLLVGQNLVTQEPLQVEVFDSNASPQSGVDFLSEEYSTIELSGTANIDPDKGYPFEVKTEIVNA